MSGVDLNAVAIYKKLRSAVYLGARRVSICMQSKREPRWPRYLFKTKARIRAQGEVYYFLVFFEMCHQ